VAWAAAATIPLMVLSADQLGLDEDVFFGGLHPCLKLHCAQEVSVPIPPMKMAIGQ